MQQCIEKLFKAELMRLKLPVPKTHNLRELSDLLHQADNRWIAETMTLNRLSLAAVDFRYPDPSEPEVGSTRDVPLKVFTLAYKEQLLSVDVYQHRRLQPTPFFSPLMMTSVPLTDPEQTA